MTLCCLICILTLKHDTNTICLVLWYEPQDFVCVESAQVSKPVELNPGEEWWGEVNVSVFDH